MEAIREVIKGLYFYFVTVYGEKFNRSHSNEEMISLWWQVWSQHLSCFEDVVLEEAMKKCASRFNWPPSLSEFVGLCNEASGIPALDDCFSAAVRHDLSHPVTFLAHQAIGSYAMSHDAETVLREKFKKAYDSALVKYRSMDENTLKLLASEKKSYPLHTYSKDEIVYPEQSLEFTEGLKSYREKEEEKKDKEKVEHPVFDKSLINPHSKTFDSVKWEEYRNYLLGCSDEDAASLPRELWYDRIKFLRQQDAQAYLRSVGYTGKHEPVSPEKSRFKSGQVVKIKDWM